jgi:glycosyltransferase involved in cell wall biosynthesis
MMHLFINALAASAGGGLTYVRNLVPHLAKRDDVSVTILLTPRLRGELATSPNISFVEEELTSLGRRFLYEQRQVPRLIQRSGANILLCTGNFALWNSPVPQILLSRNALYTSTDFLRDLQRRGDYGLWLDTRLKSAAARKSIQRANCTVAPSVAFAQELSQWSGAKVLAIHHGFDHEFFFHDQQPLPPETRAKLAGPGGSLRLLFVSHYNYYRNFETLIRALALLKQSIAPRQLRLILTCNLRSDEKIGAYRVDSTADLVSRLGVQEEVVELGAMPYRRLHHLYRSCDLYVTPAYAESFAHPLVEAMASGLPVVVSDLPVHREICGDAALYFSRFSPEALADSVLKMLASSDISTIREKGRARSHDFSWKTHVEELLKLSESLAGNGARAVTRSLATHRTLLQQNVSAADLPRN